MKYKISKKRTKFLREKFIEYSFHNNDLDTKALDAISEPIELDYIAKNHNYDDGNEVLMHIVNNSNCDFSTVKMIFFRADLNGFLIDSKKSEDEFLIKLIIENCEENFYKQENFFYNPNEDIEVLEFDLILAKKTFPSALFGNAKGKRIEPNFAEKFHKRNIIDSKIEIKYETNNFKVKSKTFTFEYNIPKDFIKHQDSVVEDFLRKFDFPDNLNKSFNITEKQLKSAIMKPYLTLQNSEFFIVLFIFNSKSLLLENAITNVATIMRNEFIYLQAFYSNNKC
ncbi:MAG: DUF4274 domain-containing protein [Weeksellaceae bacterium]